MVICFKNISIETIKTYNLGFMWNDFNADQFNSYYTSQSKGGRFSIGRNLAQETLKLYNAGSAMVRGFIRAHQHNDTMPGILDPQMPKYIVSGITKLLLPSARINSAHHYHL